MVSNVLRDKMSKFWTQHKGSTVIPNPGQHPEPRLSSGADTERHGELFRHVPRKKHGESQHTIASFGYSINDIRSTLSPLTIYKNKKAPETNQQSTVSESRIGKFWKHVSRGTTLSSSTITTHVHKMVRKRGKHSWHEHWGTSTDCFLNIVGKPIVRKRKQTRNADRCLPFLSYISSGRGSWCGKILGRM